MPYRHPTEKQEDLFAHALGLKLVMGKMRRVPYDQMFFARVRDCDAVRIDAPHQAFPVAPKLESINAYPDRSKGETRPNLGGTEPHRQQNLNFALSWLRLSKIVPGGQKKAFTPKSLQDLSVLFGCEPLHEWEARRLAEWKPHRWNFREKWGFDPGMRNGISPAWVMLLRNFSTDRSQMERG